MKDYAVIKLSKLYDIYELQDKIGFTCITVIQMSGFKQQTL